MWSEDYVSRFDDDGLAKLVEHALITSAARLDDFRRCGVRPSLSDQRAGHDAGPVTIKRLLRNIIPH